MLGYCVAVAAGGSSGLQRSLMTIAWCRVSAAQTRFRFSLAPRFEVRYAVYPVLTVRDDLCKQECPCTHGHLCALCLCERPVDDVEGRIGAGRGRAKELLLEGGGV